MTDDATVAWEAALIADMRANDGRVTEGPLAGHPLLILTSRGARTGAERQAILTHSVDGEDYIVAGTAGGSPTTPGWVHNVAADPSVTVETGNVTFPATATVVADGDERERLWADHVAALPWFADYPDQTGRVIPMIRIRRAA
jgi:deazaflavin-dependent oxidoreductase (nitroreductase family)